MSPTAPDQAHPREGKRKSDKPTMIFLFFLGFVVGLIGLAHALSIPAHELGFLDGDAEWKDALIAMFLLMGAVELFTGNITFWAGQVLRGIATRMTGGTVDETPSG